jgi:serine/threonine-protein kinase
MDAIVVAPQSPTSIDDGPRCPHCSAETLPDAQFCEDCGQNLNGSNVEPIPPEEDSEVDEITLEVPPPEEGEAELASTTDRVLTFVEPDKPAPREIITELYTTQEPLPVERTELYIEDEEPELVSTDEPAPSRTHGKNEHHRTTSFEPSRTTSDVRMTVESRAVSTGRMAEDRSEPVVPVVEPVPVTRPIPRRGGTTAVAPVAPVAPVARSRRARWETSAIIACLVVLFALLAVIAWKEISRRRLRTETLPKATPTAPAASATRSPAAAIVAPQGMVYVPGGILSMGRDGGDEFERPVHKVTVAPFFIDRTEVTNAQYQKFIFASGHRAPSNWKDGRVPPGEAAFPVVNVSWEDALACAKWQDKRLPTEAEWEFAARGTEGRLYPWGTEWQGQRANTREGGPGRVLAAGSFPKGASPYGVLDLSGNVWEWTASDLTSYGGDSRILAPGKVIRGGAWDVPRDRATATYRGVVQPERTYEKTGFRCVRSAK